MIPGAAAIGKTSGGDVFRLIPERDTIHQRDPITLIETDLFATRAKFKARVKTAGIIEHIFVGPY